VRLLLGLVAAAGAWCADLTGIWTASIPGRNPGDVIDVAFKFTQSGVALTGKMYGDYGSFAISEGKAEDGRVSFILVTRDQAGNEINITRSRYEGKLVDGALELTRTRESSTRSGSGAGVQFRGNASQTFRLTRLL